MRTAKFALGLLCAATLIGAPQVEAKPGGCLKYGVAGAVAGHYAGHHAMKGAIAGCPRRHSPAAKRITTNWRGKRQTRRRKTPRSRELPSNRLRQQRARPLRRPRLRLIRSKPTPIALSGSSRRAVCAPMHKLGSRSREDRRIAVSSQASPECDPRPRQARPDRARAARRQPRLKVDAGNHF